MIISQDDSKETTTKRMIVMVRGWRDNADMTVHDVAREMGIDVRTVLGIERNPMMATFNTMSRYAAACGVRLQIAGKL